MQQTGNLLSAQVWNNGVKALNDFLSNKPTFKAVSTLGQSVSNNTWTVVQYNQGRLDTDGGHTSIGNNGRYTCQVAGMYWVKGSAGWAVNVAPTCRIDTAIAKNGSTWSGSGAFQERQTSNFAHFSTSGLVRMNVGDYVEIWVRQSSGSTLSLDNSTLYADFTVAWIAQ
jgi:hypothetical protein